MSTLAPPIQSHSVAPKRVRHHYAWMKRAIGWIRYRIFDTSSQERSSFLISTVTHTLLIVLLALLYGAAPSQVKPVLTLSLSHDESISDFSFEVATDSQPSTEVTLDPPLAIAEASLVSAQDHPTEFDSPTFTKEKAPPPKLGVTLSTIAKTLVASPVENQSALPTVTSNLFAHSSTEGRLAANRGRLAIENGGSRASEAAVDAALVWFAVHQSPDGSWSTLMSDAPCNNRCGHGSSEPHAPKRIAATGLALLCFLGAGHTHRVGDYRPEVYKALMFLTESIKRGPSTKEDPRSAGRFLTNEDRYEMYEHGIAMLALCEAYQMTQDQMLKRSCQSGIDFLYHAQSSDGSWGYRPRDTGDLSIVGWQMMAMKSAMTAGLNIRHDTIRKVDGFLDSQQSEYGSFYGYRSKQREPCTTAIGLLMRLYRGWPKTHASIIKGANYIAELGPSTDGVYYDYYATQLLFLLEHPRWPVWNQMMRDHLVQTQAVAGHENGSWFFEDKHFNMIGGRLYCTAMATLTLEVYYRYMPIYRDLDKDRFDF